MVARLLRSLALPVSLALVLITASGVTSAAIGLIDFPFGAGSKELSRDRFHEVGESVEHNGIYVVLEEVGYSSAETILRFRVNGFESNHNLRTFIADQGTFVYTGFAEQRPVVENRITGSGEVSLAIRLGPAQPSTIATFEIGEIYIRDEGGEGTSIKGPWSFSFKVPASAIDPRDLDVPVGLQDGANGNQVRVERMHLSSSGLEVYYRLDVDSNFIGPAGWYVRMILPDGSWLGGTPILDDPAKRTGDLRVDFKSLSALTGLRLSFGPFVERVEGPFSFDIPLPQLPHSRPITIPVGHLLTASGEQIEVTEITLEPERFSILFSNVNPGRRTIVHDTTVEADLFDDIGNEYTTELAFWQYGEDESGASTAGTLSLTFSRQSAGQCELATPRGTKPRTVGIWPRF